eukprot:356460-Chlamydomonas_euryale.AAC.10
MQCMFRGVFSTKLEGSATAPCNPILHGDQSSKLSKSSSIAVASPGSMLMHAATRLAPAKPNRFSSSFAAIQSSTTARCVHACGTAWVRAPSVSKRERQCRAKLIVLCCLKLSQENAADMEFWSGQAPGALTVKKTAQPRKESSPGTVLAADFDFGGRPPSASGEEPTACTWQKHGLIRKRPEMSGVPIVTPGAGGAAAAAGAGGPGSPWPQK